MPTVRRHNMLLNVPKALTLILVASTVEKTTAFPQPLDKRSHAVSPNDDEVAKLENSAVKKMGRKGREDAMTSCQVGISTGTSTNNNDPRGLYNAEAAYTLDVAVGSGTTCICLANKDKDRCPERVCAPCFRPHAHAPPHAPPLDVE